MLPANRHWSAFHEPRPPHRPPAGPRTGLAVGGAQVSPLHAGFIVNNGNATERDVLELISIIQQRVFDETGVQLEREVKLLRELS